MADVIHVDGGAPKPKGAVVASSGRRGHRDDPVDQCRPVIHIFPRVRPPPRCTHQCAWARRAKPLQSHQAILLVLIRFRQYRPTTQTQGLKEGLKRCLLHDSSVSSEPQFVSLPSKLPGCLLASTRVQRFCVGDAMGKQQIDEVARMTPCLITGQIQTKIQKKLVVRDG